MKALSFRQPWAELILQGRKTLDLRTYTRDYRGPLAIHAAMEIEQAACRQFGLDPAALPRGGLVGTVILVDIVPLDEAAYTARTAEHLAGRHFREPMYGWVLRQPQRLPEVIPLRGQRNLFAIEPDSIPLADAVSPNPAAPTAPVRASQPAVHQLDAGVDRGEGTSQARPFELLVVPDTAGR